ncbi:MAG: adenine phosphoribosyltransferase [Alphaproteobacteria bacterium]
MSYKDKIETIENFPIEGISFKDLTPIFNDYDAFNAMIDDMAEHYKSQKIDYVFGIEARGFILGAALALKLGCGFVPVRKKGKLPGKVVSATYQKEYGTDTLEIQDKEYKGNSIIIDDVLATGGTAVATYNLVKEKTNVVEMMFASEIKFLEGAKVLGEIPFYSLIEL